MTTDGRRTAVGVFTERGLADNALEGLRRAGFTEDQLGFVSRDGATHDDTMSTERGETSVPGAATGAVGGGVIGGVIGAVTSLLIPGIGPVIGAGFLAATIGGAAIGAIAGGFAGSLMEMGVPEEEARFYQEQLAAGRTIVTVTGVNPDRYLEAVTIMREHGASDATVRSDMPDLDEGAPTLGMYNADRHPENVPPVMIPGMNPIGGSGMGMPYVPPVGAAAWPVTTARDEMAERDSRADESTDDYASYSQKPDAYERHENREGTLPDRSATEHVVDRDRTSQYPTEASREGQRERQMRAELQHDQSQRAMEENKGAVLPPSPEQRAVDASAPDKSRLVQREPADAYPEAPAQTETQRRERTPEYPMRDEPMPLRSPDEHDPQQRPRQP